MDELKIYKVVAKPEGSPTFFDESTNATREYARIVNVGAVDEKMATKHVEAMMWDLHVTSGEPLYEVVSVEEEA
jgi:hypothetical protein